MSLKESVFSKAKDNLQGAISAAQLPAFKDLQIDEFTGAIEWSELMYVQETCQEIAAAVMAFSMQYGDRLQQGSANLEDLYGPSLQEAYNRLLELVREIDGQIESFAIDDFIMGELPEGFLERFIEEDEDRYLEE